MDQATSARQNRTAIVLAGGEGTRLSELTRKIAGFHIPKQFCSLIGEIPLLEHTRRRVSLSVPAERISFVLSREHQGFYTPLLADVAERNLVVQPGNRGTAPAILYSLLRLAKSAPRASVLLMPSDHHAGDEAALMKYVDAAFTAVAQRPELAVLLGVAPDEPEPAYGWIEPGTARGVRLRHVLRVRRFWEKPSREIACELMAKGCLWNTLMMVGQLPTLLGLYVQAMPELYVSFSKIRPVMGTVFEADTVSRLYEHIRTSDFSRQVLESTAANLSVLPVSDVGWSDLGAPERVAKARASLGIPHKSAAA